MFKKQRGLPLCNRNRKEVGKFTEIIISRGNGNFDSNSIGKSMKVPNYFMNQEIKKNEPQGENRSIGKLSPLIPQEPKIENKQEINQFLKRESKVIIKKEPNTCSKKQHRFFSMKESKNVLKPDNIFYSTKKYESLNNVKKEPETINYSKKEPEYNNYVKQEPKNQSQVSRETNYNPNNINAIPKMQPIEPTMTFQKIVRFSNPQGSNNCFINVSVQILFHIPEFRKGLLKTRFMKNTEANPLYSLYDLFRKYQEALTNLSQISLNTTELRESMQHYFKGYDNGIPGDPVELINRLLNYLHSYIENKTLSGNQDICNPKCASHSCFGLKIEEIEECEICKEKKNLIYDNNYFIYELYPMELFNFIKNKIKSIFGGNLFNYYHQLSTIAESNSKINTCKCLSPRMTKRTILSKSGSSFILNLIWDYSKLRKIDILKIYCLISTKVSLGDLFEMDISESKDTKQYYLYGMILFRSGHYTCIIKSFSEVKFNWFFCDDMDIKSFNTYADIIDYLISNLHCPIALIYSSNSEYGKVKDEFITKEVFQKFFQLFCKKDKKKLSSTKEKTMKNSCTQSNNSTKKYNLVEGKPSLNVIGKSINTNNSVESRQLRESNMIGNNLKKSILISNINMNCNLNDEEKDSKKEEMTLDIGIGMNYMGSDNPVTKDRANVDRSNLRYKNNEELCSYCGNKKLIGGQCLHCIGKIL